MTTSEHDVDLYVIYHQKSAGKLVSELSKSLRGHNIRLFVDRSGIRVGEAKTDEILFALSRSRDFLVLVTSVINAKNYEGWVQAEAAVAAYESSRNADDTKLTIYVKM